jgi:NAD+ synthase (glutamine-hydrolysing)
VAQDGELIGKSYKALMPKYREFDDERHYYSLPKLAFEKKTKIEELLQPIEVKVGKEGIKLGLMLCEDVGYGLRD